MSDIHLKLPKTEKSLESAIDKSKRVRPIKPISCGGTNEAHIKHAFCPTWQVRETCFRAGNCVIEMSVLDREEHARSPGSCGL